MKMSLQGKRSCNVSRLHAFLSLKKPGVDWRSWSLVQEQLGRGRSSDHSCVQLEHACAAFMCACGVVHAAKGACDALRCWRMACAATVSPETGKRLRKLTASCHLRSAPRFRSCPRRPRRHRRPPARSLSPPLRKLGGQPSATSPVQTTVRLLLASRAQKAARPFQQPARGTV